MSVKINKGKVAGIDFTPMLDMVFNLLIFFMVATEFAKEDREIDVALAAASSARSLTAQAEDIFINIDRDGRYFVKNRYMAEDEVKAVLEQEFANNPTTIAVKIRPDSRSNVGPTVRALDMCAGIGIRDASVVTGAEGE